MKANKLVLKTGRIQEMSAEQARELMGEAGYGRIKQQDPHPFFVELLVAHEGVSRGKILGAGLDRPVKKLWDADRIRELAAKLKGRAVPVYLFHDADNRGRRPVGEILTAYLKRVKGAVSALALTYISDPGVREMIKQGELDTCSLEAELVFEPAGDKQGIAEWAVNAIERVSGLALGSRALARPGFAGAAVLAQVEEFTEDGAADADEAGSREETAERLRGQEEELTRLKQELDRYKTEREQGERKRKVGALVEQQLQGKSLKQEERKHLREEVGERIELKGPAPERLEEAVKQELDLELTRLTELKRLYSKPAGIRVPLESGPDRGGNPLIPGEDH